MSCNAFCFLSLHFQEFPSRDKTSFTSSSMATRISRPKLERVAAIITGANQHNTETAQLPTKIHHPHPFLHLRLSPLHRLTPHHFLSPPTQTIYTAMWCCSLCTLFSTDYDDYGDDNDGASTLPPNNGCVYVPLLHDDDDGPMIPNARKGKYVVQPDRSALPKGVRSKTLEEHRQVMRRKGDRRKPIPDMMYGNDGEGVGGSGNANFQRKGISDVAGSSDAKGKRKRIAVDIPNPEITLDEDFEPDCGYESNMRATPRKRNHMDFTSESESLYSTPKAYGSQAIENFQPMRPTMVYGGNQKVITDRMSHSSGEADE